MIPAEVYLADSSLRIVNVYGLEALAVRELSHQSRSAVLDQLARDVYRPYASFWKGYMGDEARFREWAEASLFASDHPVNTNLAGILNLRLDSLFTASANWARQGQRAPAPRGLVHRVRSRVDGHGRLHRRDHAGGSQQGRA